VRRATIDITCTERHDDEYTVCLLPQPMMMMMMMMSAGDSTARDTHPPSHSRIARRPPRLHCHRWPSSTLTTQTTTILVPDNWTQGTTRYDTVRYYV